MTEEFNAYKPIDTPTDPRSRSRLLGRLVLFIGGLLLLIFLCWLLLFSVQQVKKSARFEQSSQNLRILAIGMLNYEAANNTLPLHDNNGLSWRVHILPFIDEEELYSCFHLDEPWDSPHNIQLIDKMPFVYMHPTLEETEHAETVFQVPYTETKTNPAAEDRALFDDTGKPTSSKNVPDGRNNTLMILAVDPAAAVEWTKPADWRFDPSAPTRDLNAVARGEVTVAYADGSRWNIAEDTSSEQFRAMVTKQGGEKLER